MKAIAIAEQDANSQYSDHGWQHHRVIGCCLSHQAIDPRLQTCSVVVRLNLVTVAVLGLEYTVLSFSGASAAVKLLCLFPGARIFYPPIGDCNLGVMPIYCFLGLDLVHPRQN